MKKHGSRFSIFGICFTLFVSLATFSANAAQVGVITTKGKETLKVKQCRGSGYNNFPAYVFILREDKHWDFFDGESNVYASDFGTYSGSLKSRKFNLASSPSVTQLMKTTLEASAAQLCGIGGRLTSYSPFVYRVKLNKNRTSSTVTLSSKLKGISDYGTRTSGSFSLSGKGSYSTRTVSQ